MRIYGEPRGGWSCVTARSRASWKRHGERETLYRLQHKNTHGTEIIPAGGRRSPNRFSTLKGCKIFIASWCDSCRIVMNIPALHPRVIRPGVPRAANRFRTLKGCKIFIAARCDPYRIVINIPALHPRVSGSGTTGRRKTPHPEGVQDLHCLLVRSLQDRDEQLRPSPRGLRPGGRRSAKDPAP
jgi:hypothetical protein